MISLISKMNTSDNQIAKIASICYGKEDCQNTEALIKKLIEKNHTSVFEHAVFTFRIKAPIFVARQWFRHRMSSYTERSSRYTTVNELFYLPPDRLNNDMLTNFINDSLFFHLQQYNKLISLGVPKEIARIILPQAQITEFYWTVNARSLMNFLKLRTDKHAQKEIRAYAETIEKLFAKEMPLTHKYWKLSLNT